MRWDVVVLIAIGIFAVLAVLYFITVLLLWRSLSRRMDRHFRAGDRWP